eukprot:1153013-Pelagomonas_calceolata.AAC.5
MDPPVHPFMWPSKFHGTHSLQSEKSISRPGGMPHWTTMHCTGRPSHASTSRRQLKQCMLHQYKYQGCAYVNAAFMMTKGRQVTSHALTAIFGQLNVAPWRSEALTKFSSSASNQLFTPGIGGLLKPFCGLKSDVKEPGEKATQAKENLPASLKDKEAKMAQHSHKAGTKRASRDFF